MSAEVISLADRQKAEKASYLAYLDALREKSRLLQEQVDELNRMIEVGERLIEGGNTMTADDVSAILQQGTIA